MPWPRRQAPTFSEDYLEAENIVEVDAGRAHGMEFIGLRISSVKAFGHEVLLLVVQHQDSVYG